MQVGGGYPDDEAAADVLPHPPGATRLSSAATAGSPGLALGPNQPGGGRCGGVKAPALRHEAPRNLAINWLPAQLITSWIDGDTSLGLSPGVRWVRLYKCRKCL
jgi:hypothetical protein